MLKSTFCHIPGISAKAEQRLWAAGLRSWQGVDAAPHTALPARRLEAVRAWTQESQQRLEAGQAGYFADLLPANQHWRMFPEFRSRTAYLDIETTGLSPGSSYVTTIALYDGQRIRHYVQGQNLDQFAQDIGDYSLIVTYNGKCFDVPFILAGMGVRLEQAHIDLRYVLKSLGYGGGLKGCERLLGLDRGELDGVDGFFAVLLWQEYQASGNPRALQTLLAYNIQDVVNLEVLLVMAYNLKIAQTPFAQSHRLAMPAPPPLPFEPDGKLIQKLKKRYMWGMARW